MRWPTYERLAAELREIDAGLEEAMQQAAARLLALPARGPAEARRACQYADSWREVRWRRGVSLR